MSNRSELEIVLVAGARPNFLKIAPLMDAFHASEGIKPYLVHTGQHYDRNMSELFFRELGIPEPDTNLEVGSMPREEQIERIIQCFDPIVCERTPGAVLVVGDVNSTVACGCVASERGIPLIHVEAGLRSFDDDMPEELNRIETDRLSSLLFCTEESGVANLKKDGVPEDRIHMVGNVMIDSLLKHRDRADKSGILAELGIEDSRYAVLTLHRPSNVDDPSVLSGIIDALAEISADMPIIFPVHPRTRPALETAECGRKISEASGIRLIDPLGYLDFLKLMSSASLMLTDSGGIQEETTILGVTCLTLRENTERPVTVSCGTNAIAGCSTEGILSAYRDAMSHAKVALTAPPLWDGRAAERITEIILKELSS